MFWGAEPKQNAGCGRTLQTLKAATATQNKDEENGPAFTRKRAEPEVTNSGEEQQLARMTGLVSARYRILQEMPHCLSNPLLGCSV